MVVPACRTELPGDRTQRWALDGLEIAPFSALESYRCVLDIQGIENIDRLNIQFEVLLWLIKNYFDVVGFTESTPAHSGYCCGNTEEGNENTQKQQTFP